MEPRRRFLYALSEAVTMIGIIIMAVLIVTPTVILMNFGVDWMTSLTISLAGIGLIIGYLIIKPTN